MNKRQAKRMAARMVAGLIRNYVGAGGLPMASVDESVLSHFSVADSDRLRAAVYEIEAEMDARGGNHPDANDTNWFDPNL